MRLWKVHIRSYYFGILFVLTDTESNLLKTVYNHPAYHKAENKVYE